MYPLLRINDLFDQVGREKVFSKNYRTYGYHQTIINDEEINKIDFRTQYGNYIFMVILFVLTNGPTTFMCLMNNIFSEYIDKFVLIFIDDILIY